MALKNTRISFQNVKNFQISKVLISLVHFPSVAWFVQGRREDAAILSLVLRKDAAILLKVWKKDAAILSQVWWKDEVS